MRWYIKTDKQKNLYPYWEFNVTPSPQPVSLITYFLPWLIGSTIECEKYRYAITNKNYGTPHHLLPNSVLKG
jgi:hypothetical protein